jgi:hypothetical protein
MLLKVIAIESIKPMAFVSLLFNDSNQISCRKTHPGEPPDAVARRDIAKGETITFDSGQDTDDLLRPRTKHYEPYPPRWLTTKLIQHRDVDLESLSRIPFNHRGKKSVLERSCDNYAPSMPQRQLCRNGTT